MSPACNLADDGAWNLVSDQVMGGVSDGSLERAVVEGRSALRMRGTVRLENDGGFVQMARDLDPDMVRSEHGGIEIDVHGNGETYNVHLRTADVERSWQSYRASFEAPNRWTTHRIPFAAFSPYRIDAAFDPATLHRVGLVAIGRAFAADLSLARLTIY